MVKNTPTITTYSTRGGSGKTLISVNLAYWFASKLGKKTVIVDADIEAPSLDRILLSKPTKKDFSPEHTWVHYLDGVTDIENILLETEYDNLYLIRSPPPEIGKRFLSNKRQEWWATALKRGIIAQQELLNKLGIDWIIIDNQSGISMNSVNHMALADNSLLVLRPANYGVDATFEFLREMISILQATVQTRQDFFVWNQVPQPQNNYEEKLLDKFLGEWDDFFIKMGVKPTIRIPYVHSVSIELLGKNAGIFSHIKEFYEGIELIAKKIIDSSNL